jgi:hypothetical protein
LLPGRRVPLAGALATWSGLSAVVVFYAVLHVWGIPDLDLETRRMDVGDVTLLREYALFAAVPVSALGYLIGRALGRCP